MKDDVGFERKLPTKKKKQTKKKWYTEIVDNLKKNRNALESRKTNSEEQE